MAAWRTVAPVAVPWAGDGASRPWVSWPGVFAHGRLDAGTALLLAHLPVDALTASTGVRVLDWGAGSGFLGAGVRAAAPDAEVTLVELDALAAAAAVENVPGALVRQGDGWRAVDESGPFDVVVANPPYHQGKEESMALVDRLLAGVSAGMAPRGVMRIVVQRRLPVAAPLERTFARVAVVADEGPFRIWEGRR
jgi:16S rRNA (guanine1207-N2)-methyltransferase